MLFDFHVIHVVFGISSNSLLLVIQTVLNEKGYTIMDILRFGCEVRRKNLLVYDETVVYGVSSDRLCFLGEVSKFVLLLLVAFRHFVNVVAFGFRFYDNK